MVTVVLLVAAFAGGMLNAVAGGGSFLTLPALLYAGVPPVSANATSTFALWPGMLGSAIAYRRDLAESWRHALTLTVVSLIGGLLGGLLLVKTSDTSFMRLLPWLMLLAATTVTFGPRFALRFGGRADPNLNKDLHPIRGFPVVGALFQLAVAIYGGYFGGGMGIMMLAAMTLAGMTDIHEMNALKSVFALAINGVALATFVASGIVAWWPGVPMIGAAVCGGYLGAWIARQIPGNYVRGFVIAVSWTMTLYFFLQ